MKNKTPHKQVLLSYLKKGNSITSLEWAFKFNKTQLSYVISTLEKMGVLITRVQEGDHIRYSLTNNK